VLTSGGGPVEGGALAGQALAGVHVLVVDDDVDSLHLIQAALNYAGALVTTALSASIALDTLHRVVPHVIVSDLRMPGMDGLSFVREILKMPALRTVPVLAVTGYADLYTRRELHAVGFAGLLPKPIGFPDLISTIAVLIQTGTSGG
jgi:two-component system CheB/CheR fusion protein